MGHAAVAAPMTGADYLAWEATQPLRHEFVAGEVFAMAGAGEAHVTVAGNLYMLLRQHLAGTPCRVFITDMKLQVGPERDGCFFYPDVMVTCSEADRLDRLVKRDPLFVAEVLSPSTAAYDRGDKFARYRRLPGLREYLLADPDTRRVDLYRKGDDGLWVLHPGEPGDGVTLASVGLAVPPALLWAELPADGAGDDAAGAAPAGVSPAPG